MSDARTPHGASLRDDIEGVLTRLREPDDSPRRLVLPEGAFAVFRVGVVHEHGALGATAGYARMTKAGVQVDASVTATIKSGAYVRTVGELTLTWGR